MTSTPMDRRSFLKDLGFGLSGIALGGGSAWRTDAVPSERPPNIVLIVVDDQGYADLGCYGAKTFTTPNIDRLAAEGARFTEFYVSQAVSSASRASILTGCYAERVGIAGALNPWAQNGLHPGEQTIARILKSRGYATGIVGKWHLGHLPEFLPLQHGFDEYFGLPYSNDMWPVGYDGKPAREGWKALYPPLPLIEGNTAIGEIRTLDDQATLTARYSQKAVDFVHRHRDQPFFLYLAHSMVHVPLGVSERFRGKSEQGVYGDAMMEVDWSVGEVMKVLKQHHLEENTLVLYTSDNGPWLNMGNHAGSASPLREGKGTVFEGGARVPCIMRWPGHIPPGRVCRQMSASIDILPTICAMTEAPLPSKTIDGVNILPFVCGETETSPRTEYYFYYDGELRGVRQGVWKLLFPHQSQTYESLEPGKDGIPGRNAMRQIGLELYDLSSDAGERLNLAPQHPEIVDRLKVLGETVRRELGDRLTGVKGAAVRVAGRRYSQRRPGHHLALGALVSLGQPFAGKYAGGGEGALVDGKQGSLDFTDGLWQGFEGNDLDAFIDLRTTQRVSRVSCGFLENQYSWIFLPREITVEVSLDGKDFRKVWSTTIEAPRPNPIPDIRTVTTDFEPFSARYIRVIARNMSRCPSWHPGAGGTAWLFADEIEVW